MNTTEYILTAIDWVCELCREQSIKYRRNDFSYKSTRPSCGLHYAWCNESGYFVMLKYDFERNGKQLKKISNNFLEYVNARVLTDSILFSFTQAELDIHLCSNETAEDSDREKVIRKVQKLLAMTKENSCTENEALVASMQAQRLLAKHKMTLADVNGSNDGEKIEQVVADVGSGKSWRYWLAGCVAQSYCCKSFYVNGSSQVVFYGFKDDALVARRVYTYLFTVGNRLANAYVKAEKANWNPSSNLYSSFVKGFVYGVNAELTKQCTALALVVPDKVEKSYEELSRGMKESNKKLMDKGVDKSAFEQGYTEGKRALNGQYIENKETAT